MVIKPIVGVYIPIIRIPIKGGMSLSPTEGVDRPWYVKPVYSNFNVGELKQLLNFKLNH